MAKAKSVKAPKTVNLTDGDPWIRSVYINGIRPLLADKLDKAQLVRVDGTYKTFSFPYTGSISRRTPWAFSTLLGSETEDKKGAIQLNPLFINGDLSGPSKVFLPVVAMLAACVHAAFMRETKNPEAKAVAKALGFDGLPTPKMLGSLHEDVAEIIKAAIEKAGPCPVAGWTKRAAEKKAKTRLANFGAVRDPKAKGIEAQLNMNVSGAQWDAMAKIQGLAAKAEDKGASLDLDGAWSFPGKVTKAEKTAYIRSMRDPISLRVIRPQARAAKKTHGKKAEVESVQAGANAA